MWTLFRIKLWLHSLIYRDRRPTPQLYVRCADDPPRHRFNVCGYKRFDMPRHLHDCDQCIFLGRHNRADLYWCAQGSGDYPTLIARYGKHGNYVSGLLHADHNPDLAEARTRAMRIGLNAVHPLSSE